LLNLLALCDVDAGTDIPIESAIGGKARHAAVHDPTVFAVEAAHSILCDEWFAGLQGTGIDFKHPRQVVRVNSLFPVVSQGLLEGEARKIEPGFIDEHGLTV